jgi:uncharacterized membrane protein
MLPIVLANLADLLTFICAASVLPIEGEGNPLARFAYARAGMLGVVGLKAVGVAVILAVLAGLGDSTGKSIAVGVLVALPLVGALTNTAAIVISQR